MYVCTMNLTVDQLAFGGNFAVIHILTFIIITIPPSIVTRSSHHNHSFMMIKITWLLLFLLLQVGIGVGVGVGEGLRGR